MNGFGSYFVQLHYGENLIALPKHPTNTAIEDVTLDINSSLIRVQYWNGTLWEIYNPSAPFGNTLTTMTSGKQYWVKMSAPAILMIKQTYP